MKKDKQWEKYLQNNTRYADIINGVGCGGEQVISATDLSEANTKQGDKIRDALRKVALGINFAIIGIENQEVIDYELPARVMGYDVAQYRKQLKRIQQEVKESCEKLSAGEYLYRFRKYDRLWPVVTFILYAGDEPWSGPVTLHDIIDFTGVPNSLKELVQDYKIQIIDILRFEDTSVFKTDVREVFELIKSAQSKGEMKALIQNNEKYSKLERDAVEVVNQYTRLSDRINLEEYVVEGGQINMCKALIDWEKESREEGREEGMSLGRVEACKSFVLNLMGKGFGLEEICELAGCDEQFIESVKASL